MGHAENIITKGFIGGRGLVLTTKGYIPIQIEEILLPEEEDRGGTSLAHRRRSRAEKLERKKRIMVTAFIDGKRYFTQKDVNVSAKITTKNIEIVMGDSPKIIIHVDKK